MELGREGGLAMAEILNYCRANTDDRQHVRVRRLVLGTVLTWGCVLAVAGSIPLAEFMGEAQRNPEAGMWAIPIVIALTPASFVLSVLGFVYGCWIRKQHPGRLAVAICITMNGIIAVGGTLFLLGAMLWVGFS